MAKEENINYQKAKKVASNVIAYLSKENEGFRLIDLLVKCEKNGIRNYAKILTPSEANYLNSDDETLTKIVQLYDKNLIVRDNIILKLTGNSEDDISEQERILNGTRNYARAIAQALDKIS